MEGREGINSGVTVIGAEAPSSYHVAQRIEPRSQGLVPDDATAAAGGGGAVEVSPLSVGLDGGTVKKKRGRPRKYGPDGSVSMALSPFPISSSVPPSGEFSTGKRGKHQGMEYKKWKKYGSDYLGESVGTNFLPHIITVNTGEDITMKVISFSQQGPRAICILSATGVISNVTLRQPDSSGGTLTYEGRFEILSLTGSFMPTDNQGTRSRSGGMSVTLSSPDGRVVGGGVAGLLVAASPVQEWIYSTLHYPIFHVMLKTANNLPQVHHKNRWFIIWWSWEVFFQATSKIRNQRSTSLIIHSQQQLHKRLQCHLLHPQPTAIERVIERMLWADMCCKTPNPSTQASLPPQTSAGKIGLTCIQCRTRSDLPPILTYLCSTIKSMTDLQSFDPNLIF